MIISWLRSRLAGGAHLLQQGVQQFPLAWVAAIVASALMILNIHYGFSVAHERDVFAASLSGTLLALLLFIAQGVAARDGMHPKRVNALGVGALLCGISYGFWIYAKSSLGIVPAIVWTQSMAIFTGALLLLVLARTRSWWRVGALHEWLSQIFVSVVTACAMGGILAGGISATLRSVDVLFDVNIDGNVYWYVMTVAGFLFGLTYLLGSLVERWDLLELQDQGLQLLSRLIQWVGRPLLLVYFLVILAYAGKILLAWELPRGVISSMVVGYGSVGLGVSILFAWLNPEPKRIWAKLFAYSFVVPFLLFAISLQRRIADYGWTESRIAMFAAVLIVVIGSLTLAYKGARALLVVLLLEFGVCVGFGLGEYGLSGIARASQAHRIDNIVAKAGSWNALNAKDAAQVKELVDYLSYRFGKESLAHWLSAQQLKRLDSLNSYNHGQDFLAQVGVDASKVAPVQSYTWRAVDSLSHYDIRGMQECMPFQTESWNERDTVHSQIHKATQFVGTPGLPAGLHVDLSNIADSLRSVNNQYEQKGEPIIVVSKNGSLTWRLFIRELNQAKLINGNGYRISEVAGLACWTSGQP